MPGGRFRVPAGLRFSFHQTCSALGSLATRNRTILDSHAMDTRIFNEFRAIVGERGLICSREELHTYECDGLTNFRVLPRAVLLPSSTEQVQAIVRLCHREKITSGVRDPKTGAGCGARARKKVLLTIKAPMNPIAEVHITTDLTENE